jgi:hypothetical protein
MHGQLYRSCDLVVSLRRVVRARWLPRPGVRRVVVSHRPGGAKEKSWAGTADLAFSPHVRSRTRKYLIVLRQSCRASELRLGAIACCDALSFALASRASCTQEFEGGPGADVPDDLDARLMVLPAEHSYTREPASAAECGRGLRGSSFAVIR